MSDKGGGPAPSPDAAEEGAEGQTSGGVRGTMGNKTLEEVSKPGTRRSLQPWGPWNVCDGVSVAGGVQPGGS